ncbi:ABC transporter ATP-binding protein/permease [Chitinophaga pendula]|uniref:ABC transporter ATP-binding protein n=1 Tax=Chitinophaga pendula TaxID=2849666 RepID=UPI001CEDF296|nr:ABC transporter ATP-binding protein [Chitinophaga pendula]UCJ05008.1 ABC transporter ATP-binding protein/permease [Chitinophaga pendula]
MNPKTMIWKRLLSFLRPYIKYEALLLLLMLLGNAAALASPYYLKVIIDQVLIEKKVSLLVEILSLIFATYIARILMGIASEYLYNWISNQVLNTLSLKLFNHIIRLPMHFFKERSLGDVIHRMNNEVNNVRKSLTGVLIHFINNAITIIGLIVVMCVLDTKLFLAICLLYPLLFFSIKRFNPRIKKLAENVKAEEAGILGHLTERITNVRFIKLFNAYDHEGNLIKNRFKQLVKLNIDGGLMLSVSKGISIFLLSLVPLVTLGLGGWQVIAGLMTIGTLVAFLQYANKLYDPFQNIISLYVELINTSVSISRIFELLDHPIEVKDSTYQQLDSPIKKIELENVSFLHQDKQVINNLDFTFHTGRHYAIVGASGGGKSTIVDLLCKFNIPHKGQILVNGRNLQEIDMEDWMHHLTVNSQGYFLFNDTILENIRYGKLNAGDNELVEAAQLSGIFTDNNDYHKRALRKIGDGGVKLSGGQKQKLSLGRTLLRNTEWLIIDEATSEIDSKSEESIYAHLFGNPAFKTIIIISHRLSALKYANEIVCIDAGRIIEHGTMAELIQKKGHFYQLFESQLDLTTVKI